MYLEVYNILKLVYNDKNSFWKLGKIENIPIKKVFALLIKTSVHNKINSTHSSIIFMYTDYFKIDLREQINKELEKHIT